MDKLMPGFDTEIARMAQRLLIQGRPIDYHLGECASRRGGCVHHGAWPCSARMSRRGAGRLLVPAARGAHTPARATRARRRAENAGVIATKVTPGVPGVKPVTIELTDFKTKKVVDTLEVDACMVATGRAPYTNGARWRARLLLPVSCCAARRQAAGARRSTTHE
jgi:hypothetical protein